jgi:prephenate dehydratase
MRENIKLSSSNLTSIESFYKEMREDLGIRNQPQIEAVQEINQKEKEEEGQIMSHAEMNMQVEEWLKNRDLEKKAEKDKKAAEKAAEKAEKKDEQQQPKGNSIF